MKIFNRTEDEILFDLIARDNPNMVPVLTPENCYIGPAYENTDTDSNLYNTVASVIPRYNSGLHGRVKIKYNRIDLADLFRGLQPVKVSGNTADQNYATRAELPVIFGNTYGLPIRDGDIAPQSDAYFYAQPSSSYGKGLFKIANNKCFIGQVYVGFSYDISKSLSTYFTPPVFRSALALPIGINSYPGHPEWPSTWGYFGDTDFTEIAGVIDHDEDFTLAQANAIGLFMGRGFYGPKGAKYDPAVDYDMTNPFGYFGCWSKNVDHNLVPLLINAYPWLDQNYTHAKITRLAIDPATGGVPLVPCFFAFHYNRYVAR